MDCIDNFCCICLEKYEELKPLFDLNTDNISNYDKLTSTISEMCFEDMNNQRSLCKECCYNIQVIYKFRQKCLTSKTMLRKYIAQKQSVDKINFLFVGVGESLPEIKTEPIYDCKDNLETIDTYDRKDNDDSNTNISCAAVKNEIHDIIEIEEAVLKMEYEDNTENNGIIMENDIKIEKDIEKNCVLSCKQAVQLKNNIINEIPQKKQKDEIVTIKGIRYRVIIDTNSKKLTDPKQYICEFCGKIFKYYDLLKDHLRIHTGEKPFMCDVCGIAFTQKSSLFQHNRIHTGERKYQCNICPKTFSHGTGLKIHNRIHTGEKPYKCDNCDKSFSIKFCLKQHQLIHLRDKLHACNKCDKKFGKKYHLKNHIVTHSDENSAQYKNELNQKRYNLRNIDVTK